MPPTTTAFAHLIRYVAVGFRVRWRALGLRDSMVPGQTVSGN